ncbi:hypothetical protein ABIB25_005499 [Nakamurella sp. UYEF19]|uniref:hypothetical protein n=1 Tax=Nakamurella sp. UYEF19 TaxID=1756392 RepID=UPI003399A807
MSINLAVTPIPQIHAAPTDAVNELDGLYFKARRAVAEALSRATTDAEQRVWQTRTTRMKSAYNELNRDDLAKVLEAIGVIHAQQEVTNASITAQLAAADTRSHISTDPRRSV